MCWLEGTKINFVFLFQQKQKFGNEKLHFFFAFIVQNVRTINKINVKIYNQFILVFVECEI